MRKPLYWIGLAGVVTALAIVPMDGRSLLNRLADAGATVAQNVQSKPVVNLVLSAEQKVSNPDAQGRLQVAWQPLVGQAVVQPGTTLRYTVTGTNRGNSPAKSLVITQPVPRGMVYVVQSARATGGDATITFSIDGGKSFVATPTVQLVLPDGKAETRPVPAEAYTHVRWAFGSSLAPQAEVTASYEVRVR